MPWSFCSRQSGRLTPDAILSDDGACFVGTADRYKKNKDGRRRKVPAGSWQPTTFESELLDCGIELIIPKPHRPQTNLSSSISPKRL